MVGGTVEEEIDQPSRFGFLMQDMLDPGKQEGNGLCSDFPTPFGSVLLLLLQTNFTQRTVLEKISLASFMRKSFITFGM